MIRVVKIILALLILISFIGIGLTSYGQTNIPNDKVKVHLCIIVVKNQSDAKEIFSRLEKGELFEKLAMKRSIGPSREKGGDIGEVFLSDLKEEFQIALKGVEEGGYTNVFQLGSDFAILNLVRKEKVGLEDEQWQEAIKEDTLVAYSRFFKLYPKTKYIEQMKQRVKKALIKIAKWESGLSNIKIIGSGETIPLMNSDVLVKIPRSEPIVWTSSSVFYTDEYMVMLPLERVLLLEGPQSEKRWVFLSLDDYKNPNLSEAKVWLRFDSSPNLIMKTYWDPTDPLVVKGESSGGKDAVGTFIEQLRYVEGKGIVIIKRGSETTGYLCGISMDDNN